MASAAEPGGGMTQEQFESKRREIALRLLEKTDQFLEWDLKFNNHISELAGVLVEQIKRNPRILESNGKLEDIIRDLNAKAASSGPGVAGGDVIGGNVWDDIWGVIKELLLGEKEFIEKLLSKLFGL